MSLSPKVADRETLDPSGIVLIYRRAMSPPRRFARAAIALAFAVALSAGLRARPVEGRPDGVSAADPGLVKASIAGRKILLPALDHDGFSYVSLKALSAALGGALKLGRQAGDAVLSLPGLRLSFLADSPDMVRLEAGAATLSHPARPSPGDLHVPADFLTAVLAPLVDKAALKAPAAVSAASSGTLDVTIVGGRDTLRLVFECPAPVAWKLEETTSELLLRLDGKAGEPPWPSRQLGTPVIRSMTFEPGAGPESLVVRLVKGEGFLRADSAELKNPFRIVVEVQGGGGKEPEPAGEPVVARAGLRTIVLDPGHGGEQKGAEGKAGQFEKEITLDVARRLQERLHREGLAVILTRTEDADLPLVERTAVANREQAGLFFSIHVNASPRPEARGAETYYLAYQAMDRESGALADAENAAASHPGATAEPDSGSGGEAGSATGLILWDLAQSEHLRESSELAQIVQKSLNEALGLKDRGVKQAPFRVLMGAAMPAVLVEIGFLSNPGEETALATPEYRDKIADALQQAVMEFKRNADRRAGAAGPGAASPGSTAPGAASR